MNFFEATVRVTGRALGSFDTFFEDGREFVHLVGLIVRCSSCRWKCFLFRVLEDDHLDLLSAFLVMPEMLSQGPHIVSYVSSTRQRQEFQLVQGRVG